MHCASGFILERLKKMGASKPNHPLVRTVRLRRSAAQLRR